MAIHTVGIDIAKSVFHVVALDEKGAVLTKKKFSRSQLLGYTANLKPTSLGWRPVPVHTSWHALSSIKGIQFG
jgi:hypothetical protein